MLLLRFENLRVEDYRLPKDVVTYSGGGYWRLWEGAGLWTPPREFLKDAESIGLLDFYDKALANIEEALDAMHMAMARDDALYALALIYYSREGKYTAYRNRRSVWEPNINFWPYLQSLDMPILIAYDIVQEGYIDRDLFGCHLRGITVDGHCYDRVVYDIAGSRDNYTDEAGVRHISGWLEDYKYIWQAHLEELMKRLTDVAYDAIDVAPKLEEASREYYTYGSAEPIGRRDVYVCSTKCPTSTDEKWPHFLYFKKVEDGRVVATEGLCAGKYPYLAEAECEIVEHWDGSCMEAFCIVVDSFRINSLEDIAGKIIWGFHDDGKSLTTYSDTLAGKKLTEFAAGCTLIPDYFEFVEQIPLTNFDMKKLLEGEWGRLYGPKLIMEKARWVARSKKSEASKRGDVVALGDGLVAGADICI